MPERRKPADTAPFALCFCGSGAPLPCESDGGPLIAEPRRYLETQPGPAQLGAAGVDVRPVEPHEKIIFCAAWRFEIGFERIIHPTLADHLQLRRPRTGQRKSSRDTNFDRGKL